MNRDAAVAGVKILILNVHSCHNAGDAALLEAAVDQLRRAFPGAHLIVAANDVGSVASMGLDVSVIGSFMSLYGPSGGERRGWRLVRMVWVTLLSLFAGIWYRLFRRALPDLQAPLRTLIEAYTGVDLVVSCPGNIFFTLGRIGLPFLVSAYTVAYALMLSKPLYVMPQSVGPLARRWERAVVRALYSRARLVFVREPVSWRLCRDLGLDDRRLRLVPDLALGVTTGALPLQPEHNALPDGAERPRIGVTVINRIIRSVAGDRWRDYGDAVAGALTGFLAAYGGQAYFCPQVTGPTSQEDDRVMARLILERMPEGARAVLLDIPTTPHLLRAAYAEMDLFIATRMHSGIFAIASGVPTLLIGYLHKTLGLAEMLGMEEWVLDISEVTEGQLTQKLSALWQRRDAVREQLTERVRALQARVATVGPAIASDFDAYRSERR